MSIYTVNELVINLDHNIPGNASTSVMKFTKDNLFHPEMENVTKKLNTYPYFTSDVEYPLIIRNLDYASRIEFLFNKAEFIKTLRINAIKKVKDLDLETRKHNETNNVLFMIELLFPTRFPTYNDITDSYTKHIEESNGISGIQMRLLTDYFKTKYYSYININGETYTTRRVVWLNDILNHNGYHDLRDKYEKFINWRKQELEQVNTEMTRILKDQMNDVYNLLIYIYKQLPDIENNTDKNLEIRRYLYLLLNILFLQDGNEPNKINIITKYDSVDKRSLISSFLEDKLSILKKKNIDKQIVGNFTTKSLINFNRSEYSHPIYISYQNEHISTKYFVEQFYPIATNIAPNFNSEIIHKLFVNKNNSANKNNHINTNGANYLSNYYKQQCFIKIDERTYEVNQELFYKHLKTSTPTEYKELYDLLSALSTTNKSRIRSGNYKLQELINAITMRDTVVDTGANANTFDVLSARTDIKVIEFFEFMDFIYKTYIKGEDTSFSPEQIDTFKQYMNVGITTNETVSPKQYEIYLMSDFFKGEINDTNKDKLLCNYTDSRLGELFEEITIGNVSGITIEPWNAKKNRVQLMDIKDAEKELLNHISSDTNKAAPYTDLGATNSDAYYAPNPPPPKPKPKQQNNIEIERLFANAGINVLIEKMGGEYASELSRIIHEYTDEYTDDEMAKINNKNSHQSVKIVRKLDNTISQVQAGKREVEYAQKDNMDPSLKLILETELIIFDKIIKIFKELVIIENKKTSERKGGKYTKNKKKKRSSNRKNKTKRKQMRNKSKKLIK
jgi:hypothetical protein